MTVLAIFTGSDSPEVEVKVQEAHNVESRCRKIGLEGLFHWLDEGNAFFIPPHLITKIQVREV